MTPDWSAQAEPVPYAQLDNPQSLNLYSYVQNNPVTATDPDGHYLRGNGPKDDGCPAAGCTVTVVGAKPADIALQFLRAELWEALHNIGQSVQSWWNANLHSCETHVCGGTVLPEGELESAAAESIGESVSATEVEAILAQAASATGNESIRVTSRAAAEKAAREWVGGNAQPIYADRGAGSQVGLRSADGTRIARFTSADSKTYINLVNRMTGSNLHVRW